MRQRFSIVTRGRKGGALAHVLAFPAKQRNLAGPPDVGTRGEKTDKAPLTPERAFRVEHLDAHIVHVHAAMDHRTFIRLGDDERRGLSQKSAHLWRQPSPIGAPAD